MSYRDAETGHQGRKISLFSQTQFWTGNSVSHVSPLLGHYGENDGHEQDIHEGDLKEEIPTQAH